MSNNIRIEEDLLLEYPREVQLMHYYSVHLTRAIENYISNKIQ